MSMLATFFAVLFSGAAGWLLVRAVEGSKPVLQPIERVLYGLLAGPILMMELAFFGAWAGILSFTLGGFLLVHGVVIALLAAMLWRRKILTFAPRGSDLASGGMPERRFARVGLCILLGFMALRFLFGTVNLFALPTYWDDTIDNWNMRGKAFLIERDIILEIPNSNATLTDKRTESSYPPAVPLMKTWISVLAGGWYDGAVNGLHALWYALLVGIAYFSLRRHVSVGWSALGAYMIGSQPLVLIQGVNPYVDVLVAATLVAALGSLLQSMKSDDAHASTWLLLSGLMMGVATFTKNEVLLLHLPPYALLLLVIGYKHGLKRLVTPGLIIAAILVPWLVFKWSNGLTFGNAKAIGDLTLSWHGDALVAMWNMLAKEPNFLLTPLALVLTALFGWPLIRRGPRGVLAFFLAWVLAAQVAIYTLTPLYVEAVMQTGMGRGFLQLAPIGVMLVILTVYGLLKGDKA